MGKVLVTGASGFIGGQLAQELLARGDDVACLVRRAASVERLKALGAIVIEGDVTAADSLASSVGHAQTIYHVAGATRARNVAEFLRINADGVANLLAACGRRTTPPTVVLVSSLAAAGPSVTGRPRTEDEPPCPVSNYGRSKRAGELAAVARAGAMPITIVRPPIVLGEGDTVGLTLFKMAERARLHLVPGLRRLKFSVVHVADLVSALVAAAERGMRLPAADSERGRAPDAERVDPRGYYFVAGDQDPTYSELGRFVGESLGRRRMFVIPVPGPLVWLIAGGGELIARGRGRAPFAGIDKAREALVSGDWTCSPERARAELGFTPAASLSERLLQTAEWYRSHGLL